MASIPPEIPELPPQIPDLDDDDDEEDFEGATGTSFSDLEAWNNVHPNDLAKKVAQHLIVAHAIRFYLLTFGSSDL